MDVTYFKADVKDHSRSDKLFLPTEFIVTHDSDANKLIFIEVHRQWPGQSLKSVQWIDIGIHEIHPPPKQEPQIQRQTLIGCRDDRL
jgi:hypothetical protein